jgi:ribosome-binding protein aMBF1 (putative translation factor)
MADPTSASKRKLGAMTCGRTPGVGIKISKSTVLALDSTASEQYTFVGCIMTTHKPGKRTSRRPRLSMQQILIAAVHERIARTQQSLNSLAREADIDDGLLSRFWRGQRGLTLETADKLAKTLGLELRPMDEE